MTQPLLQSLAGGTRRGFRLALLSLCADGPEAFALGIGEGGPRGDGGGVGHGVWCIPYRIDWSPIEGQGQIVALYCRHRLLFGGHPVSIAATKDRKSVV